MYSISVRSSAHGSRLGYVRRTCDVLIEDVILFQDIIEQPLRVGVDDEDLPLMLLSSMSCTDRYSTYVSSRGRSNGKQNYWEALVLSVEGWYRSYSRAEQPEAIRPSLSEGLIAESHEVSGFPALHHLAVRGVVAGEDRHMSSCLAGNNHDIG